MAEANGNGNGWRQSVRTAFVGSVMTALITVVGLLITDYRHLQTTVDDLVRGQAEILAFVSDGGRYTLDDGIDMLHATTDSIAALERKDAQLKRDSDRAFAELSRKLYKRQEEELQRRTK
jgi:spore cortex formation protein SpoVR/YcgB (stage V sporulation)